MFRRLLGHILRADLEPKIDWSEIKGAEVLAHQSVRMPCGYFRTDALEQVLCASSESLAMYTKWQLSGAMRRIRFPRKFEGREMRVFEAIPGPEPVFRLQLSPVAGSPVIYDMAVPTWFGLWRNEPTMDDLGSGICFFDSMDRGLLVKLRARLLDGEVPEPLLNEEAMWERINGLSEGERRAALASLVMQQQGELERKFREAYPDAGPVPAELRPLEELVQKQFERIRQTAADSPVSAEIAERMKQFTRGIQDQVEARKSAEK